ncbi:MAG: 50S ribosomal protein L10 [Patescibacteria group bacterium]|nr:50S ribosomal protein L10 [Patescibacteria group bacterium]
MALSKEQKTKIIEKLRESIAKQKAMVFVNFAGLKAKDVESLRDNLRKIGAKFVVAKKTLAKLAFSEEKIDFPEKNINNELAIVFGFEDEIAPAKAIYDFSKNEDSLQIIGGYMDSDFLAGEEMITLAQLPSRKELFANLVGTLSAPVSNFVYVQKANIKGLICALEAIKNNK